MREEKSLIIREEIDGLIDEMGAIQDSASQLQTFPPSETHLPPSKEFRNLYLGWYVRCLGALPDGDLKERFERAFRTKPGILAFITDPFAVEWIESYDQEPFYWWSYPAESYFFDPLSQQRFVLMELLVLSAVSELSALLPKIPGQQGGQGFHPSVVAASGQLVRDGHLPQAVLSACVALTHAI